MRSFSAVFEEDGLLRRGGLRWTPEGVLRELAAGPDAGERAAVAGNAVTPVDVLVVLARDAEPGVRAAVAGRADAPGDVLQGLARDAVREVRYAVAVNPATPDDAREVLLGDPDDLVRLGAAENPRMPVDVLTAAAGDADVHVRRGVARNVSAPPEVLDRLARDDDFGVRCEVAHNPSAPAAALAVLSEEVNEEFSEPDDGLLDHVYRFEPLVGDPDLYLESVRFRVALNPGTPSAVLERLASEDYDIIGPGSEADWVVVALCANPSTPRPVLERLVQEARTQEYVDGGNYHCLYALVGNPSVTEEGLAVLAESPVTAEVPRDGYALTYEPHRKLLSNPRTPESVLRRFLPESSRSEEAQPLEDDGSGAWGDSLAASPSATGEMLGRIFAQYVDVTGCWFTHHASGDRFDNLIRGFRDYSGGVHWVPYDIAMPPHTPPNIVREGGVPLVLYDIATHPNAPSHLLAALAVHPDLTVRAAALGHPSCPSALPVDWPTAWFEVIRLLVLDGDADMRQAALSAVEHCPEPSPEALRAMVELLMVLASDADAVREAVAGNGSAPQEILAVLASDTDKWVRKVVAHLRATPQEILAVLASDTYVDVRRAVAGNMATPPEVLAVLASDTDVDVRRRVAGNGATPLDLLLVLASDGDAGVCEAAAANPNATDEVRAAAALMES